MANLQHSTLPSSSVHEPKHVTINGVASTGKVITNSGSSSGQSEYRFLTATDIEEIQETLMVVEIDASVANTHYIPTVYGGTIVGWSAIVNSAIATGTNTYELQLDTVTVTGSAISLTITPGTGGAAGDIVSATPSAANTFVAGQSLTVVNTARANTDAAVDIRFAILVSRD
jgi:hypothetical protein